MTSGVNMHEPICFSVVIPAYNRESTICRAIESVLAQEYNSSEIIVVDDGSRDNTRKVVESYSGRVRYIYQENRGVAAARNRGVDEAKYEWIAFLDSDDYWLPHHLKRIGKAIIVTGGKASLYFSDCLLSSAGGETLHWELCGFKILEELEVRDDPSEWGMMQRQPFLTPSCVIRRRSYLGVGGIPQRMVTREDTLLFHKLCFTGPACAVSGVGAVILIDSIRNNRLTVALNSSTATYWECTILLYKELLRYSAKMRYEHRNQIIEELIDSYLNLARKLLKKKQLRGAIVNLIGAVGVNPSLSARMGIRMVKKYYANRVRKLRYDKG